MAVTKADNQRLEFKKKLTKMHKLSRNEGPHLCLIKDIMAPSSDKWSLFCLYNLAFSEVLRFNELKKYIPGISSRMLSLTLKKLEDKKMVKRKVYAEVPPKVEYRLTKFGDEYAQRLVELNLWVYEKSKKK